MYMKKTLSALSLCIAGMLFPVNTYADDVAPADFTGHTWYEYREDIPDATGTMTDPFIISTPGQLAQLAYNVNTGAMRMGNVYSGFPLATTSFIVLRDSFWVWI